MEGEIFSPGGACFKRPKRRKRPKPMFAGFFAISKRPREPQWDALKSEFGPMITVLGTLGRLRFFGVVLRLIFNHGSSFVRSTMEGGDLLPGGVFSSVTSVTSVTSQ